MDHVRPPATPTAMADLDRGVAPVDLEGTIAALRRQSEVLGALQRRCAQLRDAAERTHAEIDAAVAAIDAAIDAALVIAERAATADPDGAWRSAVTELERQLRRLGVLRSQALALHVESAGGTRRESGIPARAP